MYDILAARFGTRLPPHQSRKHSQSKLRQHDRALKEVTRLKNETRRAFRKAKREGADGATVCSLPANFLSLLCQHSWLSRDSSRRLQLKETKRVREECHRIFWKFTKELLDGESSGQTSPEFSASTAYTFFSEVYQSSHHVFQTPVWIPTPSPPKQGCSMQMSPVTEEELARVIKTSRSSSSPSPFDRISYTIFKRYPSLHPALLDLYNRVIMEGTVPLAWKVAGVKLIPKSSAKEDPTSPSNFRTQRHPTR